MPRTSASEEQLGARRRHRRRRHRRHRDRGRHCGHKDHHDDSVPSWAVGEFRGFDDRDRTDVTVTIFPGGNAEGDAGGSRFTGRWDKGRLSLGEYRFRVDKSGNGFMAVDERDGSHRVYFRRVGGGY